MTRHVNIHNRNRPTVAECEALIDEASAVVFLTPRARRCLAKLAAAVQASKGRRKRPGNPKAIEKMREGLKQRKERVEVLAKIYAPAAVP